MRAIPASWRAAAGARSYEPDPWSVPARRARVARGRGRTREETLSMSSNLAQILADSAERHTGRPAIKLDDAVISYRDLDEASARAAALLKSQGVKPGDRVGIMLPNVPYFAIAYYGVLRAGGVVVPMNVLLKERETAFYLSDPGARAVIAWHEFAAAAQAGADAAGAECLVVAP